MFRKTLCLTVLSTATLAGLGLAASPASAGELPRGVDVIAHELTATASANGFFPAYAVASADSDPSASNREGWADGAYTQAAR